MILLFAHVITPTGVEPPVDLMVLPAKANAAARNYEEKRQRRKATHIKKTADTWVPASWGRSHHKDRQGAPREGLTSCLQLARSATLAWHTLPTDIWGHPEMGPGSVYANCRHAVPNEGSASGLKRGAAQVEVATRRGARANSHTSTLTSRFF